MIIGLMKECIKKIAIVKRFLNLAVTGMQITYQQYIKYIFTKKIYWPKHKNTMVANPRKIYVGKNVLMNRSGCYFQGAGKLFIGNYVNLTPNNGLLTSNHDLYNQNIHHTAPIYIGDYSWIGMNSIIAAGVTLGPRTVVAAGAVVTKSFPDGFCVLAGVPAKVVKVLDKEKFEPWHYSQEFYGFIPKEKFENNDKILKKYLDFSREEIEEAKKIMSIK